MLLKGVKAVSVQVQVGAVRKQRALNVQCGLRCVIFYLMPSVWAQYMSSAHLCVPTSSDPGICK